MHDDPGLEFASDVVSLGRISGGAVLAARHVRRTGAINDDDRLVLVDTRDLFRNLGAAAGSVGVANPDGIRAMGEVALPEAAVDALAGLRDSEPSAEGQPEAIDLTEFFKKVSDAADALLADPPALTPEAVNWFETVFDRLQRASVRIMDDLVRPGQEHFGSWASRTSAYSLS